MAVDLVAAEEIDEARSGPLVVGLLLAVATVLADSSVVVLALPDVLSTFDVSIERVSWVITGYNLVLALAAVPAAYLATRAGANGVAAAGLAVFALASAACTVAGSFDLLLAARCVQAASGAVVVCAALRLLPRLLGSPGTGGGRLGRRRGDRGGGRAGCRRGPDPGVLVARGVRRSGTAGARPAAAPRAWARPHARRGRGGRRAAPARPQPGARARVGGAHGGPLPARPRARAGMEPLADRGRRRAHGDPRRNAS